MNAAAAVLFDALRQRGDAPFLVHDDSEVSAAALLAGIEHAREKASELSFDIVPGGVVGLLGRHPALRIGAPLLAWSQGLCALPLSDREPDSAVEELLEAAGARWLLACRAPGVWSLEPRTPRVDVTLPAGTLLATSGSAGRPKLVVHELEQHLASARSACGVLEIEAGDRLLLSLPTWHAGGLGIVLRAIVSGATLCVPGEDTTIADAMLRHRPTHVSLVATQLLRLLQDERTSDALRACRAVLLGGGPLPGSLRARALEAGVPIVVSYGATETSALLAASAERDVVLRPQSAGRPLPGRDVRIDEDGQICVGGPTLFAGYLIDGQVRPERAAAGLWATGDMGRLEDGVLYVTGRRDRMFISGGENVQPEEIESALLAIDGVDEAVVVGVADEAFGARPVAFVAGEALDADVLDRALRLVLPGFKTPDRYYRLPTEGAERMKPDLVGLAALLRDAPESLERL